VPSCSSLARLDDGGGDGPSFSIHVTCNACLRASFSSSTTSIGSSILRSRQENGRTYHAYKEGKYVFPDDENEKDRLDLQHHIYLITYDGKLSLIPEEKKKIQRVLDVGTGTGIWALDYGDEHPDATVLGVDLSPMQPSFVAPNVTFEVDDLEEDWLYKQKFDFIHSRMMTGSFKDWPRFFRQAFEFLTPGGYLELSDIIYPVHCDDGTLKPDSALARCYDLLLEASVKLGRPLNSGLFYKKQMEEVGFVDIVERRDVWASGRWPKDPKLKELGVWTQENALIGLEGFSMALLTRVHGWTAEEVQVFLVDVRKDSKNPKNHVYWPITTIYGRKPE